MTSVDLGGFRPVTLRARTGPAVFATDAGELALSAVAPDVVRLRVGPATRPDYGLLEAPLPAEPATLRVEDGRVELAAGRATLEASWAPLRIRLARDDVEVLTSITDRHFRGVPRFPAIGYGPGGWIAALALEESESVYGLGEKFGPLDRRGQLVSSWNEDALGVNTERSYKNAPFGWSPRGWGVFVHTPARVVHGVGYGPWSHRTYVLVVEDEALDLFLFAADTPAAILDAYTRLTGRPAVPPLWSLGTWASRAYYRTPDEALDAARELRRRRFPCDVITIDGRAWQDTPTRFAFEWDSRRWPDPPAVLAQLRALDFRVCVWEYPLVSVHHPLHAELARRGYLLTDGAGQPYRHEWDTAPATSPFGEILTPLPPSGLLDFTHPEAYAWWRDRHAELFAAGVDVIKSDFGEQVPVDALAANGDVGARLHNVYSLLYNRCVFEATGRYGRGAPVVWGRAGWTGSQRYPVQWGGDPQADWGGLAASIRGGLSWGMSGVPCHGSDVGGFYGAPDAELYLRWLAQAVFSPLLRFHGVGPREPWAFGPAAETIARQLLELRYRLVPYLATVLDESARTGLPVMRAMPLAFPGDRPARAFDTQYLLGPSLLVAPVVRPGGRVEVWLPEGAWYDFWTGAPHVGPGAVTCEAPLDRIPVFGRGGHDISLGRVVQHTGEIDLADPFAERRVFGPGRR
jgi:alpha-D-xyloside xylohydrolase